jgi:hypothetical protein
MGLKPIVSEVCSQGYPESAICVQRFDDSLNSAIRITYRISLRSSSLREPRYPLLTVVREVATRASRVCKVAKVCGGSAPLAVFYDMHQWPFQPVLWRYGPLLASFPPTLREFLP